MTQPTALPAAASPSAHALPRLRRAAIGIDFAEPSLGAAKWFARQLGPGVHLELVHVVDVPKPPRFLAGRYPPAGPLVDNAARGAAVRLEDFGRALSASGPGGTASPDVGTVVRTVVRTGHSGEQLAAVATGVDADLIVVGAHGERPGAWALLGSTAQRLAQVATAPVLLARNLPDGPPATIMAAIDDSEMTRPVLAWTRLLAERFPASRLVLLHVIDPLFAGAVTIAASEAEERKARDELRWVAEDWLAERVREEGLPLDRTRTEVGVGEPAFEILQGAERVRADLVVLGRHGAAGLKRLLLGRATDLFLRGGRCSALLVPGPE